MRYYFNPERRKRIQSKEKCLEQVRMLGGICIVRYHWWKCHLSEWHYQMGTIIMPYSFNLNIYLPFVLICPTFGRLSYVKLFVEEIKLKPTKKNVKKIVVLSNRS